MLNKQFNVRFKKTEKIISLFMAHNLLSRPILVKHAGKDYIELEDVFPAIIQRMAMDIDISVEYKGLFKYIPLGTKDVYPILEEAVKGYERGDHLDKAHVANEVVDETVTENAPVEETYAADEVVEESNDVTEENENGDVNCIEESLEETEISSDNNQLIETNIIDPTESAAPVILETTVSNTPPVVIPPVHNSNNNQNYNQQRGQNHNQKYNKK